jgi:hypothetical protein
VEQHVTADTASFTFIISLAAVVNGLGIVRWLTGSAEYLRRRQSLQVTHYWVFTLTASFQFFLHILLWWSLWGLRGNASLNFVTYLYVLTGPLLLYLGTFLLSMDINDDRIDLRDHYTNVRPSYATTFILLCIWMILSGPIIFGFFPPNTLLKLAFLVLGVALRVSANSKVHGAVAVLNWLTLVAFIGIYSLELGGAIRQ